MRAVTKRHNDTCPCPSSSCLYRSESEQPSIKQFIANASNKIDQLYLCKYLPLRERKLVRKLHKTRAIYNRIWDENSANDDCICDLHHRVPCEGMDTYNHRQLRLCRPNGQISKGAYYSSQGGKSRHHGKSLSMSTIKKKRPKPQQFRSVPCSCDFECYKSVEELVCGRPDKGHLKQKSEKQKIKVKKKTQVLPSKSTETQKPTVNKMKKIKESQFNIRKDSLEKFREKQMKDKETRPTKSSPELGQLSSASKTKAVQSERDSKSSKKTNTSYKKIRKDTEKLQKKQGKTASTLALKRCICTVALAKNKKDKKNTKVTTTSQQNRIDSERCFCTLKLRPKNDYVASEPLNTRMRQDKENMKVQTSLQNLKHISYPSFSSPSLLTQNTQTRKDEKRLRVPRRVPAKSRLLQEESDKRKIDKTRIEGANFTMPRASDSFSEKRSHECLRIESSFCLDIGLYKNRPILNKTPAYYDDDGKFTKNTLRRNRPILNKTPAYYDDDGKFTKNTLRRCFCTLELNLNNKDNVAMDELLDGKPRKVYTVSHAMVPGTVQYFKDISIKNKFIHRPTQSMENIGDNESTSLISVSESNVELNRGTNVYKNLKSSNKNICIFQEPTNFNRDKIFCTMFSTAYKLDPYECEPGVCVPGKCDPYVCYKRIMQRGGIQYQHLPSKDRKNAVHVDSKVKMDINRKNNKREKTVSKKSTGVSRIKQKSQTKHAQFDENITEKGSNTPPRLNKNKEKTIVMNTSRSTLTSKRLRGPGTSDTSEASTQSASRKPKTKTKTVSRTDEKKNKSLSRGDETTQPVSHVERTKTKPAPRIFETNSQAQRIRSLSPPSDVSDAAQKKQALISMHSNFNLCISFSKDGLAEAGDGVPRNIRSPCASYARPCNRNICPRIDCSIMPPCGSSVRPFNRNIRPRGDDLRLRTAGVSTNLRSKFERKRGEDEKNELQSRTVQHTTDDKITIKVSKKQKQNLPPNKNIGRETKQIPEIRDEAISADFKTDNTTMTKKGFKPTKIIEPAENKDNTTMTKKGYKPEKIIEPYEEKRPASHSEPISTNKVARVTTSRVARDTRPPPPRPIQRRDFVPPRRFGYDQGYESSETERRNGPIIRVSSCFSLNIEINKPGAKGPYEEHPIRRYEEPPIRRDQQLSYRRRYEERPSKKSNKERISKSTAKKEESQQEQGTGKPSKSKANKGITHKGNRHLKLQTQDTGSKKTGTNSVLQRCFCTKNLKKNFVERCLCTLKLQKDTEKFRADDNECKYQCCNAKTMTKSYNAKYPNAKTMIACNPDYENAKTMTGSDIKPCKDACVGAKNIKEKKIKSKKVLPSKKALPNSKLLPYECEPGICTPGQCDPYKCLDRIHQRNVVGTYYAHTYNNKLSRKFTPKRLFSRFLSDGLRNQSEKMPMSNFICIGKSFDYPTETDQTSCCLHGPKNREALKNRYTLIENYDNDFSRNDKIVSSKRFTMNILKEFSSTVLKKKLSQYKGPLNKTLVYMESKTSNRKQKSSTYRFRTITSIKLKEITSKLIYGKFKRRKSNMFPKQNTQIHFPFQEPEDINCKDLKTILPFSPIKFEKKNSDLLLRNENNTNNCSKLSLLENSNKERIRFCNNEKMSAVNLQANTEKRCDKRVSKENSIIFFYKKLLQKSSRFRYISVTSHNSKRAQEYESFEREKSYKSRDETTNKSETIHKCERKKKSNKIQTIMNKKNNDFIAAYCYIQNNISDNKSENRPCLNFAHDSICPVTGNIPKKYVPNIGKNNSILSVSPLNTSLNTTNFQKELHKKHKYNCAYIDENAKTCSKRTQRYNSPVPLFQIDIETDTMSIKNREDVIRNATMLALKERNSKLKNNVQNTSPCACMKNIQIKKKYCAECKNMPKITETKLGTKKKLHDTSNCCCVTNTQLKNFYSNLDCKNIPNLRESKPGKDLSEYIENKYLLRIAMDSESNIKNKEDLKHNIQIMKNNKQSCKVNDGDGDHNILNGNELNKFLRTGGDTHLYQLVMQLLTGRQPCVCNSDTCIEELKKTTENLKNLKRVPSQVTPGAL